MHNDTLNFVLLQSSNGCLDPPGGLR